MLSTKSPASETDVSKILVSGGTSPSGVEPTTVLRLFVVTVVGITSKVGRSSEGKITCSVLVWDKVTFVFAFSFKIETFWSFTGLAIGTVDKSACPALSYERELCEIFDNFGFSSGKSFWFVVTEILLFDNIELVGICESEAFEEIGLFDISMTELSDGL